MANILNIETSGKIASVCLTINGKAVAIKKNEDRQRHAAWLHDAIGQLMKEQEIGLKDLSAIAVSMGPGSYTGLRLGMATAKGLCFALQIPLICIPTLEIMALAAHENSKADFYCPMIDARRMEVFAAVYDNNLSEVSPPCAIILEEGCLNKWLEKGSLVLSGDGAEKAAAMHQHPKLLLSNVEMDATAMTKPATKKFEKQEWSDLAYSEPYYLKEFYTPAN